MGMEKPAQMQPPPPPLSVEAEVASGRYDTKLSADEEKAFQEWKKRNAPNDSGHDYDLRGAFKSGLMRDEATQHWSDRYKKPNHPTFSNESIYAKDRPDLAGSWDGDTWVPPNRRK